MTTPSGDTYLIGGRQQEGLKLGDIYKYESLNKNLLSVGNMKIPRSSHGVCFVYPYIYLIGGFTNN